MVGDFLIGGIGFSRDFQGKRGMGAVNAAPKKTVVQNAEEAQNREENIGISGGRGRGGGVLYHTCPAKKGVKTKTIQRGTLPKKGGREGSGDNPRRGWKRNLKIMNPSGFKTYSKEESGRGGKKSLEEVTVGERILGTGRRNTTPKDWPKAKGQVKFTSVW